MQSRSCYQKYTGYRAFANENGIVVEAHTVTEGEAPQKARIMRQLKYTQKATILYMSLQTLYKYMYIYIFKDDIWRTD